MSTNTKLAEALRRLIDASMVAMTDQELATGETLSAWEDANEALAAHYAEQAAQAQAAGQDERAAFEAWVQSRYSVAVGQELIGRSEESPNSYVYDGIGRQWQAWQARAALAQRQPLTASGWIPVTERLPKPDSGEVLVWLTGGRCAFDEWYTHREDPTGMSTTHTLDMGCMWRDYEFDEITHWMPLPAVPGATTGEQQHG